MSTTFAAYCKIALCYVTSQATTEDWSKRDMPLAETYASMYDVLKSGKAEFDIELTRKLNPDMPAFESWVDSNKEELEKILE